MDRSDLLWVFDVDGCLIDSLTGTSLRPGARELLEHLHGRARAVVLWSAGGAEYARDRAEEQGVAGLFDGFHDKATRDADGRYLATTFLEGVGGAVFVDDRPEDMPLAAEVIGVSPYLSDNPHDRGLLPVAQRAGLTTPRSMKM